MAFDREGEPRRERDREQTGTPPTGRAESPQPRMIKLNRMMEKSELALHQGAADALTEAGLGTYSYTIAEEQIIPATGRPVGKNSPFVVITYSGLEDTKRLFEIINKAKVAKQDAERKRKSQKEVEQVVQDSIKTGVVFEIEREAYLRAMYNSFGRRSGQ
jgi:hypothetical protein